MYQKFKKIVDFPVDIFTLLVLQGLLIIVKMNSLYHILSKLRQN